MNSRLVVIATAVCVIAGAFTVAVFTVPGTADWLMVALAFIVGVCVGVAWDDAWDLFRSAREESHMAHESETPEETKDRHRFNGMSVLGWFLILVTAALLAVGVMLILTRNATEDYSRCTAQWQQQFGKAYTARVSASIEVSDAMDDIVKGVAEQDKAEFDKAVQHYLDVRTQQKKDQAANPLPPLPEVLCGTP